jgi:biopolymer transport protein ExbD
MAFSAEGTSRGYGLSSEINVTPLIDVLLVMLIIFMVIVPVAPRGLNSALPSASSPGVEDDVLNRPIVVQVTSSDTFARYSVDGADVSRAEIAPRLLELLSKKSGRRVLVRADSELDFGTVAGVINAGQAAGAESIGLVTPGVDQQTR